MTIARGDGLIEFEREGVLWLTCVHDVVNGDKEIVTSMGDRLSHDLPTGRVTAEGRPNYCAELFSGDDRLVRAEGRVWELLEVRPSGPYALSQVSDLLLAAFQSKPVRLYFGEDREASTAVHGAVVFWNIGYIEVRLAVRQVVLTGCGVTDTLRWYEGAGWHAYERHTAQPLACVRRITIE